MALSVSVGLGVLGELILVGARALADEAGMTLLQMAVAFVSRHPPVTSAIIARPLSPLCSTTEHDR